ncbi:MAG TPA: GFA family protein [Rhizomicrobium sp.]|nr:GFA family protein [Rhizomicrobium sp.]
MTDKIEGGCRCGKIRYRLKADRLPNAYACHCHYCQTWSGSAFSVNIVVPEGQIELTGEPQLYERTSPESGRTSYQRGCATCFTRIFNTNSARPGLAVLRAGSLDNSDTVNVVAHIWTKRKMHGIAIPDGVPNWPEGAPPAEFAAVLMR